MEDCGVFVVVVGAGAVGVDTGVVDDAGVVDDDAGAGACVVVVGAGVVVPVDDNSNCKVQTSFFLLLPSYPPNITICPS